jgi:transcriptional regulator with XRE-family HTH domain
MDLKERLIELRKKLGLTRTEFAARIGVSAAYIHILESGKQDITLRVLESISRSFDIPITYFFEDINLIEDTKLNLKKLKVNYLINKNNELKYGDFGELHLPKKIISEKDFVIKYEGKSIDFYEIKNSNFILVTIDKELYNQDRLIIKLGNYVKFCTLCIKRGNYILLPVEENDFSFILDEKKMDVFKIKKVIDLEN